MTATAAKAQSENFMVASPAKPEAGLWLEAAKAPANNLPDWAAALRETAAGIFASTGLPAPTWEGWQYTNLRGLKAVDYKTPATMQAVLAPKTLLSDSWRVVLANGEFRPELSNLPPALKVAPVLAATDIIPHAEEYLASVGDMARHPFKALNNAALRDGVAIHLSAGQVLEKPLEVIIQSDDGLMAQPRLLYMVGENAQMTVFERFEGRGKSFINAQTDIVVSRSARLTMARLVDGDAEASHISQTTLHVFKDAHFECFSGAFENGLQRQYFEMRLLEPHAYSSLSGIYLKRGQQHQDFSVLVDHYDESGVSAQHFKGVIDDQARAVFQGKIHVHRAAQKTDGYQSHHALLLSERAEANAKPELEIYADDVKCSHGATAGQLDKQALFYLRSRGIPEVEARALMIRSFLAEGIDKIAHPEIQSIFRDRADVWLEKAAA